MPVRAGRGERSRGQLLEAALVCFSHDGLEGASVRVIARRAGQNVASISYHFGGKEGLYREVLSQAVRRVSEAADMMRRELGEGSVQDPDEAIELLKRFFGSVFRVLIADKQGILLAPLIVREQTRPTAAFDVIYEGGMRRTHETVSRLVGLAIGVSAEDPVTVLRTHSLMGQFLGLITARETLLRRMGWKDFSGHNADAVMAVVEENVSVLLRGLRQQKKKKAGKS